MKGWSVHYTVVPSFVGIFILLLDFKSALNSDAFGTFIGGLSQNENSLICFSQVPSGVSAPSFLLVFLRCIRHFDQLLLLKLLPSWKRQLKRSSLPSICDWIL